MNTYRLSPAGRRTAIVLLVGALIIWAFALWTLRSTLGSSADPSLSFSEALAANLRGGMGPSQLIPALLMLVLVVATPLVIWNILEEWAAAYTPTEAGLRFESLGIALTYPWAGVAAIQRVDEDADEPSDELIFAADYTGQIRSPLARWLHRQAYGPARLPIYAGVERRGELLDAIIASTGLAISTKGAAQRQEA